MQAVFAPVWPTGSQKHPLAAPARTYHLYVHNNPINHVDPLGLASNEEYVHPDGSPLPERKVENDVPMVHVRTKQDDKVVDQWRPADEFEKSGFFEQDPEGKWVSRKFKTYEEAALRAWAVKINRMTGGDPEGLTRTSETLGKVSVGATAVPLAGPAIAGAVSTAGRWVGVRLMLAEGRVTATIRWLLGMGAAGGAAGSRVGSSQPFTQADVQAAIARLEAHGIQASGAQSSIDPKQVIRIAEAMRSGAFQNKMMEGPVIVNSANQSIVAGTHRMIAAEMARFNLSITSISLPPSSLSPVPLSSVPLQSSRVNPPIRTP